MPISSPNLIIWTVHEFNSNKLDTRTQEIFVSLSGNPIQCNLSEYMRRVKRKDALEHAQNAQIQIILRMLKVSSGPLLSINTFCTIQWFC